jgi:hypothetical protein
MENPTVMDFCRAMVAEPLPREADDSYFNMPGGAKE